MGFDYRSHLLFHSGPRRWAWINRTSSAHPIFGLCFISRSGSLSDPYFLRMVEAEKEQLKESTSSREKLCGQTAVLSVKRCSEM